MRAKARTLRRLIATGGDETARPDNLDDIGSMTWSLLTDVLGEPAGAVKVPPMPLRQMFALYDALRVLYNVALGYAGNHRFDGGEGILNQAPAASSTVSAL